MRPSLRFEYIEAAKLAQQRAHSEQNPYAKQILQEIERSYYRLVEVEKWMGDRQSITAHLPISGCSTDDKLPATWIVVNCSPPSPPSERLYPATGFFVRNGGCGWPQAGEVVVSAALRARSGPGTPRIGW